MVEIERLRVLLKGGFSGHNRFGDLQTATLGDNFPNGIIQRHQSVYFHFCLKLLCGSTNSPVTPQAYSPSSDD